MLLLVPSDPLRPRRPDEHFAAEARAARDAGLNVAMVDHDVLARGEEPERAVPSLPAGETAVYRGWMLAGDRYGALAQLLAERGVTMRTSAEQYRRAHELPGWYPALAPVTPRSVWTTDARRADFDRARLEFGAGPVVLRDYVKSTKHHWDEAAFVPDVSDADHAWRVASRMRQLRDDDFVGGFVLREFETFTSAEVRTWWVEGRCVLVGPHPDTPEARPPHRLDLDWLVPFVGAVALPFVTVDLALRVDGVWRVVELGDGQVSDRPASVAPAEIITALAGGEAAVRA
ncbi:ATP-grasp domain-containing protein [Micromonospora sp. NPDC005367]|uniref:ATP-grasp domain-containing protein n=1 Tax=Micromonospora sp. NPDC005367 TaxID=3155590 RepID=UPI0033A8912C